MIRAILTDIEGTTTSLQFVHNELFPYSRRQLRSFIEEHGRSPETAAVLEQVRTISAREGTNEEDVVSTLERWIDGDRKLTPLKTLQGLLWEAAFRQGQFTAHVYADVPAALRRWRERGLSIHVFSSGSARAQRALFQHTLAGDLSSFISGWFDTNVGAKGDAASYRAIAAELRLEPSAILFLSDTEAELDAARAAGLATVALVRGPTRVGSHRAVTRFDELSLHVELPGGADPGGDPARDAELALDASALASARRADVASLARFCYQHGWSAATSGNYSARVDPGRIAITASGTDKSTLGPEQVLLVDESGAPLEPGAPSAETLLHCALYRSLQDVGMVAHTHSVAATVLSRRWATAGALPLTGYEMAKALHPAYATGRPLLLPIVDNQQDMQVLARQVSARLDAAPAPAYLVAGHGLTTWARTLPALRRHVEALEFMLACELASAVCEQPARRSCY